MVEKKFGLIIGNNYPEWDKDKQLKFAVDDAIKVQEILKNNYENYICNFDEVILLTDKTKSIVSAEIETLFNKTHENDLVFIYFSGHGKTDSKNNLRLFLDDTNEKNLISTSLSFDFINECRENSHALKASVIVVLDCCYSAAAGVRNTDINEALASCSSTGMVILTSTGSTGSRTAREDENLGHGIFTYYLIEGIEKGYADRDKDGLISIDDLYDYAFIKTIDKTRNSCQQSPQKKGSMEGTVFIGINSMKIKEREYELRKKKLLDEFGDQLPSNILSECQATLRKYYKTPSILEKDDKIIYGYIDSLLENDLLPEKRSDSIENCIEVVQHLRIDGNTFTGTNSPKIGEKEYELKKKKLLDEFGDQLPSYILRECHATLRKYYKNPSVLGKEDKILLAHIESLLKDNLLPEKQDEAIENCIEAIKYQKKKEKQEKKQQEEFLRQREEDKKNIYVNTQKKEMPPKKPRSYLGKNLHLLGLVLVVLILVVAISMASNIIGNLASNRAVLEPMHPVANFSVTSTSGNAPFTVTFTDNSINSIYKWWNFGDGTGTGSSANTINHTYFNAGKYKVYLKVTNAVGNNTSEPTCITVNKTFYTFDPNNGNDSKSLWGVPLSSLPSYKTYHLPAKEGYIVVQNQYDFIDETTSNYLYPDPTDGNGFYISTLSPDRGHWSWSGSYTPDEEESTEGLIQGSQDHVSNKSMPSGKGAKVRIYSPYTRMTVIAVIGDNGPAPWTGCQFGASNKVFKALGLPDSYNGSSKENPNPGHGSNMSDPTKYPVVKYADNPYWVEVSWADQSLPAGPLTSSNKSR